MALSPFDPRWDPFREFASLRDAMDRLFETSFLRPSMLTGAGQYSPQIDLSETDNEFRIRASLPGMRPEDVKISVQNNIVTIEGERREEKERREGEKSLYSEHRYGSFCRSISLPMSVQADQARAECQNGILELTLPKSEAARPKQIPIRTPQPAIEGQRVEQQPVQVPGS